jgi:hypothetical protein
MPWQITLVDLSTRMAITLSAAVARPTLEVFSALLQAEQWAKRRNILALSANCRSVGRKLLVWPQN